MVFPLAGPSSVSEIFLSGFMVDRNGSGPGLRLSSLVHPALSHVTACSCLLALIRSLDSAAICGLSTNGLHLTLPKNT
jgi:hypothetical protein